MSLWADLQVVGCPDGSAVYRADGVSLLPLGAQCKTPSGVTSPGWFFTVYAVMLVSVAGGLLIGWRRDTLDHLGLA